MCCREKTIYPGQTLTLKQPASSYNLPAGLMPGTKAILKAHSYGGMTIDVNGVEWRISDRCVAYELEYQIGPHWVPASDPRVVQYLADVTCSGLQARDAIARAGASPTSGGPGAIDSIKYSGL